MAKIFLMQALPASRLESPENLARALDLLEGCDGQEADLICFPEYFPFSGEEALAAAASRLQAYIVAGLVEEEGGRLVGYECKWREKRWQPPGLFTQTYPESTVHLMHPENYLDFLT